MIFMKAGGSCFISRILTVLLCLSAALQYAVAGDYEKIEKSNLWRQGANINGIRQDLRSASMAEIYGGYEQGEFRNYSDALRQWQVGAKSEGLVHFDKMSMFGKFSFRQWQGSGMCGSMFIYPGFYPVDVQEFTPGTKNWQTYGIEGGIAYDIAASWRLGVSVDFTSDNLAKRKDLRHTNYRLDFGVAPAVMYYGDDFAFGLSYMFRKNTENVNAEQIGSGLKNYDAFIDKGLGYGLYQGWRGTGIHLAEPGIDALPVRENLHNVAFQGQYKGFYAELGYTYGHGFFGEKDITWFDYPSHILSLNLAYKAEMESCTHIASLKFEGKYLENREHIIDYVMEGGVRKYMNVATNNIFSGRNFVLTPVYEFWSRYIDAGMELNYELSNNVATQIYPCAAQQDIHSLYASAFAEGHILWFDIRVKLSYSKGFLNEKTIVPDASSQPYRYAPAFELKTEYLLASKICTGIDFRYTFWKGMYVAAEGMYLHGLNIEKIAGHSRWGLGLRYGYEF